MSPKIFAIQPLTEAEMLWMLGDRPLFSGLAVLAATIAACAHIAIPAPSTPLSEDQTIDLMRNPERWLGRTITMRIYPYDNGYAGSYVACLEPCDAAGADDTVFLIYTVPERFRGFRGDRSEVVQAVFERICPDDIPTCLDAPIRVFALHEAR